MFESPNSFIQYTMPQQILRHNSHNHVSKRPHNIFKAFQSNLTKSLALFFPIFPFDPPENIREPNIS